MITEDEFAATFEDLAGATRFAYPGLFKKACKLYENGVHAFGLTQTLVGHITENMTPDSARNFPKLMAPVIEPLLNYSEHLLRYPKGVERAKAARKTMESLIAEKRLMRQRSSCKKNCSACCHMKPYATESEVDLIMDYVVENNIKIDVERLKKQAVTTNFEHMRNLSWEDSACVFLSPEGGCGIYPVRPLTCMKHFVMSDPMECDVRTTTFKTDVAVIPKAEILTSAFLNIETPEGRDRSDSLPELLLQKIQ